MSYVDQGLEAITSGHPRTGYAEGETDWSLIAAVTGFLALAGIIVYASEKQRRERQKYMTPMERSMDDYLHAMSSRAYYDPYPRYAPPLFQIQL